eukprot:366301-Chlamydomonas_euryale.AAC.28
MRTAHHLDVGGVRRRDCLFGHRKAAPDVAAQQRQQPLQLLLPRAVLGQHLHVAGVGRAAVEDLGCPRRPAPRVWSQHAVWHQGRRHTFRRAIVFAAEGTGAGTAGSRRMYTHADIAGLHTSARRGGPGCHERSAPASKLTQVRVLQVVEPSTQQHVRVSAARTVLAQVRELVGECARQPQAQRTHERRPWPSQQGRRQGAQSYAYDACADAQSCVSCPWTPGVEDSIFEIAASQTRVAAG